MCGDDWLWIKARRINERTHDDAWFGTDLEGRKWLLKADSCCNQSYCERTFAALAQEIGICCQSSVYLKLHPRSAPLKELIVPQPFYAASVWLDEHGAIPCCAECPLPNFGRIYKRAVPLENLATLPIGNVTDWLRGELLACLCGTFEPPGRLFTTNHIFVQIDNEGSWSGPKNFHECQWLYDIAGLQFCRDVYSRVAQLSDAKLDSIATLPAGLDSLTVSNLRSKLDEVQQAAVDFMASLCSDRD